MSNAEFDRGEVVEESWATVVLATVVAVLLFWLRRKGRTHG
jgi:hypothetical protein